MAENKRITYIPPKPPKREKRVGIYCHVSTNSMEQLKSLTAQVSEMSMSNFKKLKWEKILNNCLQCKYCDDIIESKLYMIL